MTVTLDVDGAAGRLAIYTGSDDAPMTNPLGNLSRVKHHSSLDYTSVVMTAGKIQQSGTLTLPARGAGQMAQAAYPLFSHGRVGVPLVEVSIYYRNQWLALNCSVPVQGAGVYRWLTGGADGTYVYINENWTTAISLPGMSIPWRAIVTNVRLA